MSQSTGKSILISSYECIDRVPRAVSTEPFGYRLFRDAPSQRANNVPLCHNLGIYQNM